MNLTVDQLTVYLKERGPVILLESQSDDHPESKVTYLAALPEVILKARDGLIEVERGSDSDTFAGNPWDTLVEIRREYGDWLFGYLGYDLKNALEDLQSSNPDPVEAPDMFFMIPGLLVRFGRKPDDVRVLKGELPDVSAGLQRKPASLVAEGPEPVQTKEEYLTGIREARRRIGEGDFYEINLSHQLCGHFKGDSFELYKKMREVGPVPFGAYLSFEEWSVCCLSPERFLRKAGSRVCSQPIKGTVQRGDTESEDIRLKSELKASAKDRAENLMIVDLVRNDLNRIAQKGSVTVSRLFEIQTFGTVHQMVSAVEAESCNDPVEIIKACYPMGSMTGAPKISVMKAVEELEHYRRGIYSGAIGYFSPEGDFDFNVVIRTAIIRNNRLYYPVGGAITGDSVPEKEWEETLVKARAITKAVT